DGVDDMRTKMRALHGDDVQLRVISMQSGGLLSRLRRPRLGGALTGGGFTGAASLGDDLISAVETRAMWSRFGL
ncbi:MAG: S49 family peptidase, partial [Pseudomonadota bacterium]